MVESVRMNGGEYVAVAFATLGALFLLISSYGVLRLKGVHQRMQATSVGTSSGITLLLLSAGIHYWDSAEFGRMVLLVVFFFVTAPIAATAMSRAGYRLQGYRTRRYFNHDDLASPHYVADFTLGSQGAGAEARESGGDTTEQRLAE
jgi:monovalent cation/proton antiporter MnhG/PhaG subunit